MGGGGGENFLHICELPSSIDCNFIATFFFILRQVLALQLMTYAFKQEFFGLNFCFSLHSNIKIGMNGECVLLGVTLATPTFTPFSC